MGAFVGVDFFGDDGGSELEFPSAIGNDGKASKIWSRTSTVPVRIPPNGDGLTSSTAKATIASKQSVAEPIITVQGSEVTSKVRHRP